MGRGQSREVYRASFQTQGGAVRRTEKEEENWKQNMENAYTGVSKMWCGKKCHESSFAYQFQARD